METFRAETPTALHLHTVRRNRHCDVVPFLQNEGSGSYRFQSNFLRDSTKKNRNIKHNFKEISAASNALRAMQGFPLYEKPMVRIFTLLFLVCSLFDFSKVYFIPENVTWKIISRKLLDTIFFRESNTRRRTRTWSPRQRAPTSRGPSSPKVSRPRKRYQLCKNEHFVNFIPFIAFKNAGKRYWKIRKNMKSLLFS